MHNVERECIIDVNINYDVFVMLIRTHVHVNHKNHKIVLQDQQDDK